MNLLGVHSELRQSEACVEGEQILCGESLPCELVGTCDSVCCCFWLVFVFCCCFSCVHHKNGKEINNVIKNLFFLCKHEF